MKIFRRTVALFLILTFLLTLSAMAVSGSGAQDQTNTPQSNSSEVRYTKKVVSVLYDNSDSMIGDGQMYAMYAMQMLVSLLSERDELIITPMNDYRKENDKNFSYSQSQNDSMDLSIEVDLAAKDRNAEVVRVMNDPALNLYGRTPDSPIGITIDWLEQKGLKDSQNLASSDENVEHWLIVLTDGAFNAQPSWWTDGAAWSGSDDQYKTNKIIEHHIADFPSLKTIYISFAGGVDLRNDSYLSDRFSVTPYFAPTGVELVTELCKVSNQISGRYTLDGDKFSIDGNTVTIDLNKIDFSLKSLSVIAQDCGATLEEVRYNGEPISADLITQESIIKSNMRPGVDLGMRDGYSAVINGDSFFLGGRLEMKFSGPVEKEKISIMAEPALSIVPFVEFQKKNETTWTAVDAEEAAQYINENLIKDDKVRVTYKVIEQAGGTEIDIQNVFSDVESTITYAKKSFAVGEAIPLEIGNNEIAVSVGVMGGAYKMYSSIRCIIEANPEAYKVVGTVGDSISYFGGAASASYVVYAGGYSLDQAELGGGYRWVLELTCPDGSVKEIPTSVNSSGIISANITATPGLFGQYKATFKVYSPFSISRSHTQHLNYAKPNITIEASGTDEVKYSNTAANVTFTVKADGIPLTAAQLDTFDWDVTAKNPDGTAISVSKSVGSGGKINCSFSIDKSQYGKCSVNFEMTDDGGVGGSLTKIIKYYPDKTGNNFRIEVDAPTSLSANDVSFAVEYKVFAEGRQMNFSELSKYPWALTHTDPNGVKTVLADSANPSGVTIGTDGTITLGRDLTGCDFGAYGFEFAISFSDDYAETKACDVNYFPGKAEIIVIDGDLSLSEHQLTINERPMTFALELDGNASSFANKIFTYTLKVGGVDVTAYATLDGEKLVYVPRAEHLGAMASLGQRTVTLSVNFKDPSFSALNTSESVTLGITEVIYLIEWIDGSNKPVDRFDIEGSDASLRFRILRDGTPMPKAELEEALNNKSLSIKDKKGTFSKQFWLPTGADISVEGDGDDTVVVYRVVNDIPIVGTFLAMLIFNGDKPIEVSFHGENEVGIFSFAPSGAFAYIWRVLVILFVIYLLFYIIGFFNGKCKSIRKGTYVEISFPSSDSKAVSIDSAQKINFTFWERYSWHIWRFLPIRFFCFGKREQMKFWYHQPEKELGGVTIGLSKRGSEYIKFSDDEHIEVKKVANGTPAAKSMSELIDALGVYRDATPEFANPVKSGELRGVMQKLPKEEIIPAEQEQVARDRYFATLNRPGKVSTVVFFVSNRSR